MEYRPLIGITTYGRNERGDFTLPDVYIDSVRRAKGIPFLIPPGEEYLESLLEKLDGIVLTGGGDINPEEYQGKPHDTLYKIDKERDQSELKVTELILKNKRWRK